ncbi:hypothetical protein GLAREA_13097 [Glarea lozoyensis ATCC 20868]|uniref:Uncharacterized protein n=1 Tax=Glarea lozoyensis (strain ATCC 20868 / MF5171) TaxID=1116229 RepID=S3CYM1_GLAL2|nr:uncharacterized protein GLAREA_13097 [Glarea lozoyensis ATCC 20868]EPE30049.1 hypothetical protein GLAREA_13097 [Glarea lozoyensis ATCC 20868]
MGLQNFRAIKQEPRYEAAEAAEMHELQNIASDVSIRQTKSKRQKKWRVWHAAAWLVLLCVGGPVLLKSLSTKYLLGIRTYSGTGVQSSSLPCDVHQPWTSWSTLFEINIRTGPLSFTSAKVIDIAFDVLVGRAGQACLAWIAYRVYTDTLMRIAESEQVRLDLFAAISLSPNSFATIGITARSVASAKKLWTKFTLIWAVLAMLYVLIFPTLVSAATSLVGATVRSVQLANQGTAPIADYLASAAYSFADTGLDKPNPWSVPVGNTSALGEFGNPFCQNFFLFSPHSYGGMSGRAVNINNKAYTFNETTKLACGFSYGGEFNIAKGDNIGRTNKLEELTSRPIVCLPNGNKYQWGASWELLIVIIVLQIVWSASLLLIWAEVATHSPLVKQGRKMGLWRAVLDLARPLQGRLGSNDGVYDQKQLRKMVENMPPVRYEVKGDGLEDEGSRKDVHLVSYLDDSSRLPFTQQSS